VSISWKNFLIGACIVGFLVLLGGFNASKPRILVVNSAAENSLWCRKIKEGVETALDRNRRPLSVAFTYLVLDANAPRRPLDVETAELQRTLRRVKPHIIIAVDDPANALIAPWFAGRDKPGIIYVSIDRPPEYYGYLGARNVSGIADQLPVTALRDFADDLNPRAPRKIAFLGVDNETGVAELAQARAFDWSPHRVTGSALVRTMEEWEGFVRSADADLVIVLETQPLVRSADDATIVPAKDIVLWTERNSRALPVGTDVQHVEDGGVISFSPPPDDYGRKAMEMAIDWLDGRDTPGAPPPVESSHFEVGIREEPLKARGVVLPPIYLEAARENGTLFK
jgi:hypothetical protein